jgi:general secretion pathway protein A
MYCEFFKLVEEPFNMAPDPKFLFLSQDHRDELAGLTYGIMSRKRLMLLTGDIGTGKTTLIATILRHIPRNRSQFSVVANTTLTPSEVVEAAILSFGVREIPAGKNERLAKLEQVISQGDRDGRISTLIFDEAHKLSPEALEEIRLMGNCGSLQILLAGQRELDDVINSQGMRALKQRIALWLKIGPLRNGEVELYIRHRWEKAGGGPSPPFSPDALAAVSEWSQGVPRLINSLCDNALILAFKRDHPGVSLPDVEHAALSLGLARPERQPRRARPSRNGKDSPSEVSGAPGNGHARGTGRFSFRQFFFRNGRNPAGR